MMKAKTKNVNPNPQMPKPVAKKTSSKPGVKKAAPIKKSVAFGGMFGAAYKDMQDLQNDYSSLDGLSGPPVLSQKPKKSNATPKPVSKAPVLLKPPSLNCPLTKKLFVDPVLLQDCGHSFEKLSLEQYFETKGRTCPTCKAEVGPDRVQPNLSLKRAVRSHTANNT